MGSKSKTKQNTHLAHGKDGTPWIVDENGNKIKKVRKKVRRRASVGHAASNDNSQSSFEFGTSNSMNEFRIDPDDSTSGYDTSGKKMMSFRTEATEMSTSHHSSSRQGPRSLEFRSPKAKTPKKSKKSKSLKSVNDDTWWHIDDDIKQASSRRIVKKSSSKDRLSSTDHGPSSSMSVMTPVSTRSKKKKKKDSKSKSVRHISSPDLGYDSGHDSPIGTVNTTGTGSIRPKPRRLKSTPDMSLELNDSGDLDMLMSQSVHDHIRKPASAKPKLGKSKNPLGKIGKKLGKASKALSASSRKLNMSNHDYGRERSLSPSKSNRSGTHRSNSSRGGKPLPKDIREIDGVLWRVDEFGNKLNKVRRKSKTSNNGGGNNGVNYTSSDESFLTFSSRETQDYNYSSGDSFISTGRRRLTPQQRRNSFGSVGAGSVGSAAKKPDSEKSIYIDLNDKVTSTPRRGTRSKSMGHGVVESPAVQQRRGSAPGTPGRRKQEDINDGLVQNLQHRLKNSEKEVARLCRVTMEQQDKMEDSKRELKIMRDQLSHSNHNKQTLMMELENLKLQIEKRKDRSNKSLELAGGATVQELMEQLCDVEDEKEALEKELASERALCKQRLLAKEEEVRFLQEELERMRAEQGEKQLAYLQKMSVSDDDEYSFNSSAVKSSPRRHGHSMQFVGKILGNHLKDKAETEVALQKEEIRNLQDRVCQLQQSNEKLTTELKQATLEIKDDDDEEMRFAKEAAMKAASLSQPAPKKDLRAKVMSLSRRHRSDSDADDNSCLSLSFRGGVGDCVRNGRSVDVGNVGLSQSFRHQRPQGLY